MKKNGMSCIPMKTAASIPKNTPVPIAFRLADPGPEASTIGSMPNMNANEVISIGRKRSLAACSVALRTLTPASVSSLANSTISMAFLAASPISITSPIWKYVSFSSPQTAIPM